MIGIKLHYNVQRSSRVSIIKLTTNRGANF